MRPKSGLGEKKRLCLGGKEGRVGGDAGLAQLAEQLICNQQVIGSSPIAGSSFFSRKVWFCEGRGAQRRDMVA